MVKHHSFSFLDSPGAGILLYLLGRPAQTKGQIYKNVVGSTSRIAKKIRYLERHLFVECEQIGATTYTKLTGTGHFVASRLAEIENKRAEERWSK